MKNNEKRAVVKKSRAEFRQTIKDLKGSNFSKFADGEIEEFMEERKESITPEFKKKRNELMD